MSDEIDCSQIPLQAGKKLDADDERLIETFEQLQKNQLEFLDQAGKRIIELSSGLLGVLFAVIAFGKDYPPPYLADNPGAQWLSILVLCSLVVALFAGVLTVQPRRYSYARADLSEMREKLLEITRTKSRWIKTATWAFFAGTMLLAVLVGMLILKS